MNEQTAELIASLEAQNRTLREMIRCIEQDLVVEERRSMLRYF